MKKSTYLSTPLLCAGFLATISCNNSNENNPPNVIFILADDAGYADFGCYGATRYKTPNIDALANSGILFTQAYVTGSVCCPSRAAILTGRYQQRFGHEFNGPDARPMPGFTQDDLGLDPEEKTVGDYMKKLGYTTCFVGKWNMGLRPQFQPWIRGFDDFYGFLGGARSFFPIEGKVNEHHVMIHNKKVVPEEEITYTTDDFTNYTIDFIKKNKDNPFYIYLSHNAVHTPMHAKEEDLKVFEDIENETRRKYLAMMKSMDEGIGKIIATLKSLGLEDNTLVIFFNDNGGTTHNASNNGELRGWKGSHWEGGIRVPCIIKWPNKLPKGKVYTKPVSGLDFLPTIYAAANGEERLGKPFDGVNLIPYLVDDTLSNPHNVLYWRMGAGAAVRKDDWKLVRSKDSTYTLYDLSKDVSETTDLSGVYPDIKESLIDSLLQWENELTPPKWTTGGGWIKYDIVKQLEEED